MTEKPEGDPQPMRTYKEEYEPDVVRQEWGRRWGIECREDRQKRITQRYAQTATGALPKQPFYHQSAETPYPSTLFLNHIQLPIHECELAMRDLSYAIRSKPEWWKKYRNPDIRAKWIKEALDGPSPRSLPLQPEHVEYVLDELEEYDLARDEVTDTQPSVVYGSWEAERLLPEYVHNKLLVEVDKMRHVSEEEKDWHPGSHRQVLDLVHPSMYCLRYGETESIHGQIRPPLRRAVDGFWLYSARSDAEEDLYETYEGRSLKTAWLPTDFLISPDGTKAEALGYINNVHPDLQGALHNALCDTLSSFLPLFERAPGDLQIDFTRRVLNKMTVIDDRNIPVNEATGKPYRPWDHCPGDKYSDEDSPDEAYFIGSKPADMSEATYDAKRREWSMWKTWMRSKPYIDPLPPKYVLPGRILGTGAQLGGRKIQVIVKIAEIQLTPEKPKYRGGGWHVEGMLNESIVATGLYYLLSENITTSRLSFRVALERDGLAYQQEDSLQLLWRSYRLKRNTPLNTRLGSFVAKEGRAIVFPNLYQHRVEPFELADPTKPGRRTIVAFFLCDPTYRIPSTSDVPPRLDWLRILLAGRSTTPSSHLNLPQEIKDRIVDFLEQDRVVLDRESADEVRASLMEERSAVSEAQDEAIFEEGFSLCEH